MIHSMTGFGKSEVSLPDKKITLQLKSLNSKKLDLYVRIPSEYAEKELEFQKIIADKLQRGKIDFSISVENLSGKTSSSIDPAVVKNYIRELKTIEPSSSETELLGMAIRLPNTIKTQEKQINKEELSLLEKGLHKAIENLNQYRKDEGRVLAEDFKTHIAHIENYLEEVEQIDSSRVTEKKQKLTDALLELKEEIDPNRFEQELIYYLEKYDINEEKTRLRNHLNYFMETLNLPSSNGRKLGFISQEMGREINTIGSKSNYAPMQKLVVQMKDELEKIKEQILNVL